MKPTRNLPHGLQEDYVGRGYWERITLHELCTRNAALYKREWAVIDAHRRITWAGFEEEVDRLATYILNLNLRKDDVFLVVLPNVIENFTVRMALYRSGIMGAYMPMTFRESELTWTLNRLRPKGVIVPGSYRSFSYRDFFNGIKHRFPELEHFFFTGDEPLEGAISIPAIIRQNGGLHRKQEVSARAFDPFESSMIFTSSGSTGEPKLVEQNQAGHMVMDKNLIERLELTHKDVFGIFVPLSSGPGMMFFFCALELGSKAVLMDDYFADEAFRLIEEEKITCISTTTAVLMRMLEAADSNRRDISSLRIIRCGAAAISPFYANAVEEKLNCILSTAAGSAESLFTQTGVHDSTYTRHCTVGKIVRGNECRIVDDKGRDVERGAVGELWVRGASSHLGYFKDPEATSIAWTEEGWYKSGDLVKQDSEGNLIFVGRKKDMIIRGGQNIYPREIENILLQHPCIRGVAVVAIPDRIMGEKACACLVLKDGVSLRREEVLEFLKSKKIAPFKLPERIEFFVELPLLGSLKVDKKALQSVVTRSEGG